MEWIDFYLKFSDQEDYGLHMPEAFKLQGSDIHATDVVGVIYHEGTYDNEGNMLTPPVAMDGYHVNMRLRSDIEFPAELSDYAIEKPAKPKRVFA